MNSPAFTFLMVMLLVWPLYDTVLARLLGINLPDRPDLNAPHAHPVNMGVGRLAQRAPAHPAEYRSRFCERTRSGAETPLLPAGEGRFVLLERAESQRRPYLIDRYLPDWSHAVLGKDGPERVAI